MEAAVSHSVLRGRPFGRVVTLVHNEFAPQVKCLKGADRAVILSIDKIIFINVYLPCYNKDNHDLIVSVLAEIVDVICLYPDSDLILGGDLNMDLSVITSLSQLIKKFMSDGNMTLCTDLFTPNCTLG